MMPCCLSTATGQTLVSPTILLLYEVQRGNVGKIQGALKCHPFTDHLVAHGSQMGVRML